MIHMHTTLSSGVDTSTTGKTTAGNTTTGSTRAAVSQATMDNFQSALSDAVSSTLEKFGIDPNQVQISITPASTSTSTRSAGSTATATPTSTATTPAISTAPNGGYNPFLQASADSWAGTNIPAASSSGSTAESTSEVASSMPAPSAETDPQLAFDNSYWAQQPAAVQALRTMQDPEQRSEYAHQLASDGYTIDVPIMVWGWDPSIVTSMRQADGYTWVPSAMQNPVEVAPGLGAMGNLAAYDPANPPAGSIAVS